MDIKNVDCSRLGTMLHLDIQKVKEATNASTFQQQIRGTAACMKRLMVDTKGCGKMTSYNTYFSDGWFIGVKTAEEAMFEGVDYCVPVKTSHKDCFLAVF